MSNTAGFVREDGKPAAYDLTGQETGRTTKYRPELCDEVVALGSEGKSKVEIAFELGVVKATLDNWAAAHPEFLAAITRAKQAEQAWWERQGRTHLTAQVFQASMWSRSMAARFPDDWRETSRQEQTGPDGGPVKKEVHHTGLDEFSRRIAGIATRSREGEGNSDPDGGAA